MQFFLTLFLIVVILASFFVIGIAFLKGGIFVGFLFLAVCLYLVYLLNRKINKLNGVNESSDEQELDISSEDIKNKLIFINTKSLLGVNIIIARFIWMSMALMLVILILKIFGLDSISGYVISFSAFLVLVLTVSISDSLKGKIEFIDIDNNDIYIIAHGIFKLKYKRIHFKKIENLKAVRVLGKRRQRISASIDQSFTGDNLLLTIDNQETIIFQPSSRKSLNNLINDFKKIYALECSFETFGRSKFSQDRLSFKNTLYNYDSAPRIYVIFAIYFLAPACITYLIHPEDYMFLFPFFVAGFYNFVLYFKSKKNFEESLSLIKK